MDEKPTDSSREYSNTQQETLETPPETLEDIDPDTNTNLPKKLMIRRILSCVGTIIGLGILAFTFNAYAQCPAGECSVSYFGTFYYMVGAYLILLSTSGFVTTSKSYLNTQKQSRIGIVFGGIISSASVIFLVFVINSFVQYHGDILTFIILPSLFYALFVLPLMSIWLFILLKSLRLEKRFKLLLVIVPSIAVALAIFGTVMYLITPEFITDSKNDQQFSKISETVSYANRYKMVEDFLDAINKSDVDKASSFYYPLQKGSDVIPDVKQLIDSRNKYLKNDDHKYAIIDYTKQECMVDSVGNHYYYFVRLNTQDTSPYVIDINLINEDKTNLWFIMSRFYTTHADIKTSVCQH